MDYPLRNYTIRVDNLLVRVFDDMKPSEEDERIHLELNDTSLSGVTLDSSFLLTITACNDITCRRSDPANLSKCYFNLFSGSPQLFHHASWEEPGKL